MRKLSEIVVITESSKKEPLSKKKTLPVILFEDILNPEKVLKSDEIRILADIFYGKIELELSKTDFPEKLQERLIDEFYRANEKSAMIYPVKAKFEDWVAEKVSDVYSGPLYITIIKEKWMIITCNRNDGLFRNEYYPVGVIGDVERLIEKK